VSRIRGRLEGVSSCFGSRRISVAAAALAVIVLGVGDAFATMLEIEYTGPGMHDVVRINYLGKDMRLPTGINNLLVNDVPFESYCVDLDHFISETPWMASLEPVSILNGGEQAAWLWTNYGPGVNSDDSAAALQLALWEVVADWDGVPDLSEGNFRVYGSKGVVNEASAYLSSIPNVIGHVPGVSVLHSEDSQDFLVPETATWLMFILTASALVVRRRL
jgi:hypothetical protein